MTGTSRCARCGATIETAQLDSHGVCWRCRSAGLPPDRRPTVADITARCDQLVAKPCPTCKQEIPRSRALLLAMAEARRIIARLERDRAP